MIYASQKGHHNVIDALCNVGAGFEAKDEKGNTAYKNPGIFFH